jgi:tetratricopeptide (TPR) repeat protein
LGLFDGLKKRSLFEKGKRVGNEGDHEGVLNYYNQVLELDPEDVDAIFNKGCAFINLNRQEEALECFEKVFVNKSGYANVWLFKVLF